MRTSGFILLILLAVHSLTAGPVIFGARGGTSFGNSFDTVTRGLGVNSPSRNYLVGPTAGIRLPLGFSVEGDALFNRQSLNIGQFNGVTLGAAHTDSWEFPVMLKFTPGRSVIAPVMGAGLTVRHINNFGDIPSYVLSGSTAANTVGFVAGGGVRFKVGPVSVTPELRYTRWGSATLAQSVINAITGNRNQAEFLVGFTF